MVQKDDGNALRRKGADATQSVKMSSDDDGSWFMRQSKPRWLVALIVIAVAA